MRIAENTIPVDRTAALVIQSGVHYDPKMKTKEMVSRDILPIRAIPKGSPALPKDFEDLSGRRYGNMTVVGLVQRRNHGKKIGHEFSTWVVKCCCGNYVTRRSKAIHNASIYDMCFECNDLRYIKRSEHKRQFGRWPEETKDNLR